MDLEVAAGLLTIAALVDAGNTWVDFKFFLEKAADISPDFLHVVAGVVLQLSAAAILRVPISRLAPLFGVLAFALLNEAVDLWLDQWPDLTEQWGESSKDIVMTMLVPLLLYACVHAAPWLFAASAVDAGPTDAPEA